MVAMTTRAGEDLSHPFFPPRGAAPMRGQAHRYTMSVVLPCFQAPGESAMEIAGQCGPVFG